VAKDDRTAQAGKAIQPRVASKTSGRRRALRRSDTKQGRLCIVSDQPQACSICPEKSGVRQRLLVAKLLRLVFDTRSWGSGRMRRDIH
jgi:hypothetical protein